MHVEVIYGMALSGLPTSRPGWRRCHAHIAPPRPDRTNFAFSTSMTEEANGKLVINNDCEYSPCAGKRLALLVTLVELALPDDPLVAEQFQCLIDRSTERWDPLCRAPRLTAA